MARYLVLCCVLLAAGGCTGVVPVADRAVYYNEAVADASNRLLLLNALRASRRLPLYYTRLTSLSSEHFIEPKVDAPIDIGPGAVEVIRLALGLKGSQKDTVGIGVLDDKEFGARVLRPVELAVVKFFLDQGWPPEVILSLAVERIDVAKGLGKLLDALEKCTLDNPYCSNRELILRELRTPHCARAAGRGRLDNDPERSEDLKCFQAALRAMLALGLRVRSSEPSYKLILESADASQLSKLSEVVGAAKDNYLVRIPVDKNGVPVKNGAFVCQVSTQQRIVLSGDWKEEEEEKQRKLRERCAPPPSKPPTGGAGAEVVLRSPDAVIYYLGEVIRAGEKGSRVMLWKRSCEAAPCPDEEELFRVRRGAGRHQVAGVAFDGRTYHIPAADESHRSPQVLAFVNQLFNLIKDETKTPLIAPISVTAN